MQNSSTQSLNGSPSVPNQLTPNPPIGKLRSTATIGKPIIQAETNRVSVVQEPVNQTNKSFTTDELQVVWDKLIENLHQRNRIIHFIFGGRKS